MELHFVLLEGFVVKLANIEVITDIKVITDILGEGEDPGEFQSVVTLISGRILTLKMTRDEALEKVSQACAALDAQRPRVLRP